ncbi:L-threonine ammonia-lyase [Rhodovulum sp. ES.010]|uniref:threonine ammonia-lyase n=1 Tax=Rhodovulum sp. ES.010 TaxID=1882821 RepID=UPI00092ACA09|nr:threonine/serine dehydratase [Rhodovulum sp. ES.010]SIO54093.1 L-threonine ammonia-lyase [Rhodovulum sp. ES.010]
MTIEAAERARGEAGVTIDMIEAAAERLRGEALVSPLLSSPALDRIAGRRVLVKAECLQETGSFKLRGGWAALSAMAPEARAQGVIAVSSGNHAQGVARAAARFGVPAVIVMPSDAPRGKIEATRAWGAEIVPYDRATGDRDALVAALAAERGLTLVRPFDDPQVIAGQGTVGLELAAQAAAAGVERAEVLIPCGGGGLTAGVALALAARAPGLTARPVEPEGFDDTARSLAAGRIVSNAARAGSICDAILTPQPGALTFPIMARLCGPGLAVGEDAALRAMAAAFAHLRLVLEPGGAVALAAALFDPQAASGDTVIAIASGGNVGAGTFRMALDRAGDAP